MPIRPEERDRYPAEWPAISGWVKWDRAMGRCECEGECFSPRHHLYQFESGESRCPNYHGEASRFTGSLIVLTTAHLTHVPENVDPRLLRAMCQCCHLAYDAGHHAETRARRG
jgi:hypothetical protein